MLIEKCRILINAHKDGSLGRCDMPEDSHPAAMSVEERLAYFTLPMSLNYQRDSYALWRAARATFEDLETRDVFDVQATLSTEELRKKLLKHKLALQPNKHIATWETISATVRGNWGSFTELLETANNDYALLRELVQKKHKKGFPYLSGPKIFNYWSFILSTYGKVPLQNTQLIEIAPDTHIIRCSVVLGLITEEESLKLTREEIAARWREALQGSGIAPIQMHPPLWFWSRNNFSYKLP